MSLPSARPSQLGEQCKYGGCGPSHHSCHTSSGEPAPVEGKGDIWQRNAQEPRKCGGCGRVHHSCHSSKNSSPSNGITRGVSLCFTLFFSLFFMHRPCGVDTSPPWRVLLATESWTPRHGVDLAYLRTPLFSTAMRPIVSNFAKALLTCLGLMPSSSLACSFVL